MAQIIITIPDAQITRVVTDICGLFGYQATFTDITGAVTPNPETPNQFAKRMVVETVKSWVKTYEMQQAAAQANTTAAASADQVGVS